VIPDFEFGGQVDHIKSQPIYKSLRTTAKSNTAIALGGTVGIGDGNWLHAN